MLSVFSCEWFRFSVFRSFSFSASIVEFLSCRRSRTHSTFAWTKSFPTREFERKKKGREIKSACRSNQVDRQCRFVARNLVHFMPRKSNKNATFIISIVFRWLFTCFRSTRRFSNRFAFDLIAMLNFRIVLCFIRLLFLSFGFVFCRQCAIFKLQSLHFTFFGFSNLILLRFKARITFGTNRQHKNVYVHRAEMKRKILLSVRHSIATHSACFCLRSKPKKKGKMLAESRSRQIEFAKFLQRFNCKAFFPAKIHLNFHFGWNHFSTKDWNFPSNFFRRSFNWPRKKPTQTISKQVKWSMMVKICKSFPLFTRGIWFDTVVNVISSLRFFRFWNFRCHSFLWSYFSSILQFLNR